VASNEGRRAKLAALGAAALFGCAAPAAKALLGEIDPWLLASFLYLGSGIVLGGWLVLDGRGVLARSGLARADLRWLAGSVLCGGIAAPILLVFGLSRTTASSASLALALEAPLTALVARVLFGEHLSGSTWIGLALSAAGAAVIAAPGLSAGVDPIGMAVVALACAGWALDNNLTREIAHADARTIAACKGLVGGTVNGALGLLLGAELPGAAAMLGAGVVGALGYGASLAFFVVALRGIGAARTGGYFATAPLVGALASVVLLREPVTLALVVALVLVALGIRALVSESHSHRHRHDPAEHFHVHEHDEHHRHEHAGGEGAAPHAHEHRHEALEHEHPHAPDIHHRHEH
jgi:drug/metabolite transporter (DMT)-like permease